MTGGGGFRVTAWLLSLFRRRAHTVVRSPLPWRTCDAKRFYQPAVWQSHDHLHMWFQFLQDRLTEGRLTLRKFREKVRRARRTFEDQVRRCGGTPEQQRGRLDDSEWTQHLARNIARKAGEDRKGEI
jgi:hypothetical protein